MCSTTLGLKYGGTSGSGITCSPVIRAPKRCAKPTASLSLPRDADVESTWTRMSLILIFGSLDDHHVTNIVTTAAAIAAVLSQPTTHSHVGRVSCPMTFGCIVITIMTIISGTATMPLMTAVQNSALIGSRFTKLMAMPITVPPTIVA